MTVFGKRVVPGRGKLPQLRALSVGSFFMRRAASPGIASTLLLDAEHAPPSEINTH
jgi:hypothetical protein